jgi:hypothetical protein
MTATVWAASGDAGISPRACGITPREWLDELEAHVEEVVEVLEANRA